MQSQMEFGLGKSAETGQKPDLAVIIVNWNVRDILLQNLQSLFDGNRDANFEVIVVDNASSDGSVEAIKKAFPEVSILSNQKNMGFAAAVNQALQKTQAKHVLLLNPDMRVEPGAIQKVIRFFETNPGVGVLSGKLINDRGRVMHHMRRFPSFGSQLAVLLKLPHFFPNMLAHYHGKDLDLEMEQSVDSVRGSFFAISDHALQKIGNFDEGFFIWFEEVDYCRRAKKAGCDVRYVPGIVAHDLIGQSFAKRDVYWKQKRFTASMIHYFKKWHPRWQVMTLQAARPFVLGVAYLHDKLRK